MPFRSIPDRLRKPGIADRPITRDEITRLFAADLGRATAS